MTEYGLLALAAFCAGLVDAMVGGGGLIQVPALLNALPSTPPPVLLATNKLASVVGTASAAVQYARRIRIPWRCAWPGLVAALIGAGWGARSVSMLPVAWIRPLILGLLIAVAVYTFMRKDFGQHAGGRVLGKGDRWTVVLIGGGIGFYDGFLGPGTGSFFIFLFVRLLAMDFLAASALAKLFNAATNVGAMMWFVPGVSVLWTLGLVMAACNLAGALVGSRLALRHGSGLIRRVFLLVVSVLIARLGFEVLRPWWPVSFT